MKSYLYAYNGVNFREVRSDKSTRALSIIDYVHHEIHAGSHFRVVDYTDLSSGASIEFLFTAPDSDKEIHFFFEISTEAEAEYLFVEDAVIAGSGTTVTTINSNRNSTKTASLNLFHTPVDVTISGTTLAKSRLGAGRKVGGSDRNDDEIILKRNSKNYLRIMEKAGSANLIGWSFSWYEHTPKED